MPRSRKSDKPPNNQPSRLRAGGIFFNLKEGRKAETTLFRHRVTKHAVAIITIGEHDAPNTVDMLIHEAMHVWRDIRKSLGEKKPSSEFEAYAMQNITAQLFMAYEKTRKPLFIRQRPSKLRKRQGGRGSA